MPELPEVETTRRGIAPHAVGRQIARLTVYDPRLRWPVPADLADTGRGPDDRRARPPQQVLTLSIGQRDAAVSLRHDGQPARLRSVRPRRPHDHVDLVLDNGTLLRYHDPRRFGAMLLVEGSAADHPLLARLGPEPFDPAFDARYLWDALRTRTAAIKLALMDNTVVVGVGNIYANEALFRAGIRPTTPARKVSRARIAKLVDAVRDVLAAAIDERRQHAARLRGRQRSSRRGAARPLRVRPRGRAVPRLPHAHPHAPAGRARVALLPRLPAIAGSSDGRHGRASAPWRAWGRAPYRAAAPRSDAAGQSRMGVICHVAPGFSLARAIRAHLHRRHRLCLTCLLQSARRPLAPDPEIGAVR